MAKDNIQVNGTRVYLRVQSGWYFYDINQDVLGSGAMGTVYVGRSCDNPNYKVAIKQVNPQYADIPSIRERARIEGNLLFRHKNLVEMLGCCETLSGHGPLFTISRLVQGINLDKHVSQNLSKRSDKVAKICQTFYPVLDALQFLHEHDILHLDIKPSNIMIENGSNIRLMDLGIASVNDHNMIGMVGTPQYAAPEQCSSTGGQQRLGAYTDIYEAGVSLFELLTGTNPFDAPTLQQMVRLHRTEVLPYVPGIPRSLIDVLRKATSFDPSERYQSAKTFKCAIQAALLKPEKNRFPVILVTLICAVIIVIALICLVLWNR